ncbi:RNA/RNP complex-1-interacting phosphatase-like isoform X3 [Prinia subflava]|uniref:RNA/RNP complex-1-interacting phosphatase-like isoform X3 n=1 Tax=Prinia subflava TaxID=208062 RepID=UPI002FE37DE0
MGVVGWAARSLGLQGLKGRGPGADLWPGWTEYIPLGCRMPGTRFIAFKVPLKKSFDQNLLPEERFSPRDLIRKVEERQEELGLIIDLTYTTRYYGREELPPTLRYSKILTMGHEIPNRRTILRFKYVVKKFLTNNQDNDKLIGVHCTHGLNRTGYLVCRYLIDVEGMEPNAAIELFNKCRGHPIERTNYIQDLQKRALKSSCELKNAGSDLSRKSSVPAKAQKQQQPQQRPSQAPLAVPRNPKKKQRPDPTAEGQPQELGHGHGALEQRQLEKLEQKKWEQRQFEKREQRQQKHLEQRQQKHLEQRQQKHLEQRQQKKLEQRQQERLEQRQQKKLEQRQLEQLEQRQEKKLEQRQQEKLEKKRQKKLEKKQQERLEQRQQRKLKHLEQRQLEMQNHLEQGQQRQQNHLEQGQPCSLPPRNCWLSAAPKKKHKELFPWQSPQPWLPQEPSPGRKRRRRKRELREQEMS